MTMKNKAPALRKFKGFHNDHFATIGNYGQDCKTGELLAYHFYHTVKEGGECKQLKDHRQLKRVVSKIPKGKHYEGLIIGLFEQLSKYFEPLVKNSSYGETVSRDQLLTQLAECSLHQDQLQKYIKILIQQWLINFTAAVNTPNYDGLARYFLSDLALKLPEHLHLTKNCYTWFCYELSTLLSTLIKQQRTKK